MKCKTNYNMSIEGATYKKDKEYNCNFREEYWEVLCEEGQYQLFSTQEFNTFFDLIEE